MLLVLALACAPVSPDQARTAFLRDTLTTDNAIWLGRDTELLAGKYAKMSADPFDFMRGTSALFYADLSRPAPDREATQFLTVPDAGSILLAGDPHPENFGAGLPGEEPAFGQAPDLAVGIEIDDLDGSAFGPYLLDVRRGSLGVALLASALEGCDADCVSAAVAAFAGAYVGEIEALSAAANGSVSSAVSSAVCTDDDGRMVADLCAASASDGALGDVLASYTTGASGASGARSLIRDEQLDDAGKGLLALTPDEDAQLSRLLSSWRSRPADFRELDRARRFGSGVASFPAVRYVVLWDHGADGGTDSGTDSGPETGDDDHLVSIREVIDPPNPPGRSATVPVLFDSNAARIEQVAWLLWSRPDADPRMAGLSDGASTFKVTTWSGYFQGFNHSDIVEGWADGSYEAGDLLGLAARNGRTLADSHARGLTSEGRPSLAAISDDLGDDGDRFVAERVSNATTDLARSEADFQTFQRALDDFGPLLGAETPVKDTTR